MSDLNIFLSAIQAAFNSAVKAAVDQATAPLVERIAALEDQAIVTSNAVDKRITALENNPAQGVDATVERDIRAALIALLKDDPDVYGVLRDTAIEAANVSIESHTEQYDHDSYDNATSTVEDYDFDDFMTKSDDLEDAIRDTVRGMSFEIR